MSTRARAPGSAVLVVRRRRDPSPLELDAVARQAGLHPDVVRAFVRLGLLDPLPGPWATPRFPSDAAARLARASRLRRDLSLNYSGALFASELLARIDDLEARLRVYESPNDHAR
ncbi:MAG: chaperone modulatory protein CbpM [Gaiellales bacterium]|nr:chaperone modulatory protein CbpM [Gaiellales bacterium]